MADEILKVDGNNTPVGGGVTYDSNQYVTMLRVDPTTGYVLVSSTTVGATSATTESVAKRDGNYKPVCLAYDETNGTTQEILTDTNGNILCDVAFI